MENIQETVFDFALVLRQMYTEDILRDKMQSVGAVYHAETEYINFEVDPTATLDDYAVTTHCLDLKTQTPITFQSYGPVSHVFPSLHPGRYLRTEPGNTSSAQTAAAASSANTPTSPLTETPPKTNGFALTGLSKQICPSPGHTGTPLSLSLQCML